MSSVQSIAQSILRGEVRSVSFLTGAGISVASGIPDFRSPGGMYDTLKPELLSANERERQAMVEEPTTVVSWSLFRKNPFPYLEVRRPFIIGTQEAKWKMTIGHYFAKLLYDRQLLSKIYTQNIDGLDFQSGVPATHIIPVHGSIGQCSCEMCGRAEDMEYFVQELKSKIKCIYKQDKEAPLESTKIKCRNCNKTGGLKPSTVLYGRNLPSEFFDSIERDLPAVDLLFVIGTSLQVYPAASVPEMVDTSKCKRVLINKDAVGDFTGLSSTSHGKVEGKSSGSGGDSFWGGNSDDLVLELIQALGWQDDLIANMHLLAKQSQELIKDRIAERNTKRGVEDGGGSTPNKFQKTKTKDSHN